MELAEYETVFEVEDRHWWYQGLRELVCRAVASVAPARPLRILDVGCGTGGQLARLSRYGRAWGVDLAPSAIRLARQRGLTGVFLASASELPFRGRSFEVVTLIDVLYHAAVPDEERALAEAHRVLAPRGRLVLNVPAYEWLRSPHDDVVHTRRRYTRGEVIRLLEKQGFRVVVATYWNCLLLPAVAAVRMVKRTSGGAAATSDVWTPAPWLNRVLLSMLRLENVLVGRFALPYGSSVFCLAEKAA